MKVKPEHALSTLTNVFYILADVNLDGSVDVESASVEAMTDVEALVQAKADVKEHGGSRLIIECKCVRIIDHAN